ncbi:MAG TPA: molybdopterin-dependent oxidoreductase, partial [Candidatus Acidoferrum sp.]|nr:molybdopterin-dependent oxidoreductase [Candidatus Acidoferrum sp.]
MISPHKEQSSRRAWLKSAVLAGGCLWTGLDRIATLAASSSPRQAPDPFAGGEFLGVLPFSHESRAPLETLLGAGLDARLYTNLSSLSPDAAQQPIAIPTEHFYIRTGVSPLLKPGELTAIRLSEHGANASQSLSVTSLQKLAHPMGLHLLECAGNTREASFGLISVAEWTGVPLLDILDHLGLKSGTFVLVSGFDQYDSPSATSQPGASWIFSREQIRASGAFLAIGMNGRALPPDHGAPVRLVVPGWYGCTCIKWVNEIRLVSEVAQPTSQMREFAQRTHQQGSPTLARDYQPATIDA